jgi:hypothetical protein
MEMNNIDEQRPKDIGFMNYVFNFDTATKSEISNSVQYSVLSLLPVVILNKITKNLIPEADDEKGSLEISAEIIAQLSLIFIGIFFIHRIVTYIPPYSGDDYGTFSLTNNILVFLVVVLSLQTKLGEKIEILVDRINGVINGSSKPVVVHQTASQNIIPIQNQQNGQMQQQQQQMQPNPQMQPNQQMQPEAMFDDGGICAANELCQTVY